jgi:hypothetical protein
MLSRWALALPFVIACDGPPLPGIPDAAAPAVEAGIDAGPVVQDWQSGSRLRARVRSGEGASIFIGWFDSKFNQACAFARAEDGLLRCLPDTHAIVTYADSACTQPLDVSGTAPQPTPLYGTSSDVCDRTVYRAEGNVTALRNEYVRSTGGGCTFTNQSGWEYEGATRVDPSEFVAATISTRPIDAALEARVLVADDGAQRVLGGRDIAHDAPCTLGSAADGTSVCAPSTDWKLPLGTCAGASFSLCASSPAPTAVSVPLGCGVIGAMLGPSNVCKTSAEIATYFPADTFALLALDVQPLGGGRLRPLFATRAGIPITANAFWDTAIQDVCTGPDRCLPKAVFYGLNGGGHYSDAACTKPAIVDDGSTCSATSWVQRSEGYYKRAEPLPVGAPLFSRAGGYLNNCAQVPSEPAYATTFYPLDAFAVLEDSIE